MTRLINVSGQIVHLLLDMDRRRFRVPEARFSDLRGGELGSISLDGMRGTLERADSRLDLVVEAPDGTFDSLIEETRIRSNAACLELADGSTLSAELSHIRRVGVHAKVALHHWSWSRGNAPSFWLGRLEAHLPAYGNLVFHEWSEQLRETKDAGFRLEGKFTWYLVRGSDGHHVVVDTHGGIPTREELMRDVLCMEMTFGTPFEVTHLVGLNADRDVVAARSIGHLVRRASKHRAPAHEGLDTGVWLPEFFRLLSSKLHSEGPEPLLIAIASYLDSEVDHLGGAYLKAQVGLEAFAKRIIGKSSDELLVRDENEWRAWIAELLPEMLTHVTNADNLEIVRGKFISAMHAPTGELVKRALAGHGIDLPSDVAREVRKRNYSAHGFLMNAGFERDLGNDVRRLEMIQTLLAALVSCHIGYQGPLTGYDIDKEGERPSPTWWPLSLQEDEMAVRYVCERQIETAKHRRISDVAYFRWLARGGDHGRDMEDWVEAEREVADAG